jgi:uncharacterized repeat protein (TIGR03803 family)
MVIDLATREKRRIALVRIFCMILSLWSLGVRADVVLTTLHAFQSPALGAQPNTLVLGNDGNLYGTTAGGGRGGHGTVFKFTTNGMLTTWYSFNGASDGSAPNASLVQGSDGNFYGTTVRGGAYNYGTAFKLTPGGVLTSLYSFWRGDTDYPNNGYYPTEIIQGNDGNLYGMTEDGGLRGDGAVFKISAGGVFTKLHSFMHATTDGEYPLGAMVQGADGEYYGTAQGGGTSYRGVVFKITSNGAYTNLYSFTGGNDGGGPNRLLLGSDGNFYGTTYYGGTNGFGTVFKFTTNGVCTVIYSFSNGSDGRGPTELVQGIDGNFYGATLYGGTTGLVFRVTADGAFTTLHTFTGGNDGGWPNGLVAAPDGNLYGTTWYGGQDGNGTIFKITPDGSFVSLYSFPGATNDGTSPRAGLVQGSDGYFYGSTYSGGANNYGTIFKIGPDGAFTSLYSFTNSNTGTNPQVALIQGDDGWLYGTTPGGGTNNFGTVFKISTNGVFTSLYSFTGGSDSINPQAPLVKGKDGYLYGTTYGGQVSYTNTYGSVFKINANGDFTTLYSFTPGTGYTNSIGPRGGLVPGRHSILYGTSYSGGKGNGTIFSITADGLFTRLYSFTNSYPSNDGTGPVAGLVQGVDGSFYGTTSGGSPTGGQYNGTVFKVTANGILTTLYGNFYNDVPLTRLLRATDGDFYGTAYQRYTTLSSPRGRIFKITTNGILTTVQSFYDDDGSGLSELVQGSDGSFYCTSQNGGAGYGAVLRITIGPVFKSVTLANSTLTLTWSTDAGSTYQLQYKSDLNSGDWVDLGSPIIATGSTLTATDSVANYPQRFYRVAVLPQ